jgi:fimbrial chaperone protein
VQQANASPKERPRRPRPAALPALALVALLAAVPAAAGSFQVSPVRVDLKNGATSAALVVRNEGSDPVVVQTSLVAWAQADGADSYTPTQDALATPPIATIPPGGEQILRVGLRRGADPTLERTYRLYVQEVPPPPQAGFQGLQVALRMSVPVFVDPLATVERRFEWSAARLPDGRLRVTLANRGNVHLQITDFSLRASAEAPPLAGEAQLAYVLAGQTRSWTLPVTGPPLAPAAVLLLNAYTDAGELSASVKVLP